MEINNELQKKYDMWLDKNSAANIFHDIASSRFEKDRRTMLKVYTRELIKWMLDEADLANKEDKNS